MSTLAVQMGGGIRTVAMPPGDTPCSVDWGQPVDVPRTETDQHAGRRAQVLVSTTTGPTTTGPTITATTIAAESPAVIEERIRQQVPLVGILVTERLRTVPTHITRDDLTSAGMTALVLSARAFDPTLGVPFPVFASFRIRGALLDELRAMDWTSRRVRARAKDIDVVRTELTATLARPPRADEIATAMGISTQEVDRVNSDLARGHVLSLQSLSADSLPAQTDSRALCPESLILQRERMGYLHDGIAALPERLRLVVIAYYFHQRQMTDIAAELSVTQSRVSQMCTEALALLRDGMNSQLDPDALPPLAGTGRAAASRRAYFRAMADRNTVAGRLAMSDAHGDMRAGIHPA